jgi:hypothetical protein
MELLIDGSTIAESKIWTSPGLLIATYTQAPDEREYRLRRRKRTSSSFSASCEVSLSRAAGDEAAVTFSLHSVGAIIASSGRDSRSCDSKVEAWDASTRALRGDRRDGDDDS